MQEYISKQHQILRPAEQIYGSSAASTTSRRRWPTASRSGRLPEDRCSFKAKGFTVKLRMEERIEPKHVKIVGDEGGIPMDFAFWIQLHKVSDSDTRMRLSAAHRVGT